MIVFLTTGSLAPAEILCAHISGGRTEKIESEIGPPLSEVVSQMLEGRDFVSIPGDRGQGGDNSLGKWIQQFQDTLMVLYPAGLIKNIRAHALGYDPKVSTVSILEAFGFIQQVYGDVSVREGSGYDIFTTQSLFRYWGIFSPPSQLKGWTARSYFLEVKPQVLPPVAKSEMRTVHFPEFVSQVESELLWLGAISTDLVNGVTRWLGRRSQLLDRADALLSEARVLTVTIDKALQDGNWELVLKSLPEITVWQKLYFKTENKDLKKILEPLAKTRLSEEVLQRLWTAAVERFRAARSESFQPDMFDKSLVRFASQVSWILELGTPGEMSVQELQSLKESMSKLRESLLRESLSQAHRTTRSRANVPKYRNLMFMVVSSYVILTRAIENLDRVTRPS